MATVQWPSKNHTTWNTFCIPKNIATSLNPYKMATEVLQRLILTLMHTQDTYVLSLQKKKRRQSACNRSHLDSWRIPNGNQGNSQIVKDGGIVRSSWQHCTIMWNGFFPSLLHSTEVTHVCIGVDVVGLDGKCTPIATLGLYGSFCIAKQNKQYQWRKWWMR